MSFASHLTTIGVSLIGAIKRVVKLKMVISGIVVAKTQFQ
jgi:hypothetical protein